ncbi:MAG: calcium:proton antiporter [Hyphomicrobium sp.]
MQHSAKTPVWTWLTPLAGIAFFAAGAALGFGPDFASNPIGLAVAALLAPFLLGAVFAAVYHAEDAAHQTGEPFGTLILTISVTIIEVALILSVILTSDSNPTLVRDTVYAVIMIICTGLVGACLLLGGLRYREQSFDVTSAKIYLAVLLVLASLTLILPNYTQSAPGPEFSNSQLAFVSVVTIALYLVFLYTQTILHRDYFTGERTEAGAMLKGGGGKLALSIALLAVALAAVILLAKKFAVVIDYGVDALGAPVGVTGVIIALIVLTPEGLSAIKSARSDDLQKSLNLALGSSLATIGLTIPAVAVANVVLQKPLILGLETRDTALLITTLGASILTFGTGRTNVLFGFLHLVLFGTFLFLTFVP